MIEPTLEKVLVIKEQVISFADRWSADRAVSLVETKLAETRARFTQDGLDLTPGDAITKVDAQTRQQWDRNASTEGAVLETDMAAYRTVLADQIAAKKVLPPTVEPLVSRQERQMEELSALLIEDKLRARAVTMTRAAALEWYNGSDEQTQSGRRVVCFLEQHFDSLAFRDDPAHDTDALVRWRAVRDARQMKRVPAELLTMQAHLDEADRSVTFRHLLSHLRSGRGLAVRSASPRLVSVS